MADPKKKVSMVFYLTDFGKEFYTTYEKFAQTLATERNKYVEEVDKLLKKYNIPEEARKGVYGAFLNAELQIGLKLDGDAEKAVDPAVLTLAGEVAKKDRIIERLEREILGKIENPKD